MTVWTSYQGIEVKDSQAGVPCRHPKYLYDPKKMFTLQGVSLLLLADETLIVVCDECGFNGITGRDPYVKPEKQPEIATTQANSLLAHVNGMHHPNREGRASNRYTNEQIKVAIKVWLKWRATGILNYTQHACDELERLGFKPYSSEKWNPSQLGSMVRHYIKMDQFKNLKAGPMDEEDKAALEAMVREARDREARRGTHVADNVRITTTTPKGSPRQTYAERERQAAEFAAAIQASQAVVAEAVQAAKERQKEDEPVSATNPTLTFAEPQPSRTMALDPGLIPAPRQAPAPVAHVTVKSELVPAPVESDFKLVSDADEDGLIIFMYKGKLYGGKPAKVSL